MTTVFAFRFKFFTFVPELPEVQTIVNDLQILTGDSITGFWSDWEKALRFENKKSTKKEFEKILKGKKIKEIKRYGKSILINFSSNVSAVVHLRMTGQLLLKLQVESYKLQAKFQQDKYTKHIHHVFYLKKNKMLAFSDIRKFGVITITKTNDLHLTSKTRGIDPFDQHFNGKKLEEVLLKRKKSKIKEILMDQSLISGIGNIYASEILFDAKINPSRIASSLHKNEILALTKSIVKILEKAIKFRGTSFSDYRDSSGKKGRFQNILKVYKKAGQKCKRCDTIVKKVIIGQRSTFYCPKCQK